MIRTTLGRTVRTVVPERTRTAIRAKAFALRPPTMSVGVGRGLRFDPGRSNPAYATGDNELPVQAAFEAHLDRNGVFYDVGANVGFFTVIGAKLVGSGGSVVAFEPVGVNAALVHRNARLNGFENVDVIEQAVSHRSGTGELVLAEYSGGSALSTTTPPPDATSAVDVDLITLDEFVDAGHPPPTLVKIDVEGTEIDVLRGMETILRRDRPVVICEIDDASREGYNSKLMSSIEFVRAAGYDIELLADSYSQGDWIVGHFVGTPSSDVKVMTLLP